MNSGWVAHLLQIRQKTEDGKLILFVTCLIFHLSSEAPIYLMDFIGHVITILSQFMNKTVAAIVDGPLVRLINWYENLRDHLECFCL